MKAEVLVRQIIYVDAVLAMGGIIPSLSMYYRQMRRLIQELDQTLREQKESSDQVTRFCLWLCHLVDRRIRDSVAKGHYHSESRPLAEALYDSGLSTFALDTSLKKLLETCTGEICALTKMLLAWLPAADPGNQQAELLVAAWEERPLPGSFVHDPAPGTASEPEPPALYERAILPLAWAFLVSALILFWLFLKA